ncbi:response regulator [Luteolibacter sp. SL250]|uniref:response regulator n=1 Tax=Luteolibacter sp. SL250 TaxID=2995170 RepID=UPI002271F79A|nr:response regulator [Luteolibacter sp. SL250]WAC19555.1 response regulator [Luteolibacter sp. SL250]
MNASAKALIIDDEPQLRRLLRIVLESKGYEVYEAETGNLGLGEAAFRRPDVILLDLGLPDMDGIDVLRKLREWTETPVLILSVRDQERTKVEALESGADDYVTKPFSTPELIARLAVIQRRGKTSDDPLLKLGQLTIDLAKREVSAGMEILKLTPIEYDLLRMLAKNPGRVLTRQQILSQIWGPNAREHGDYLRVYVSYLRKKITNGGVEIRNEPGIGYRLLVPESP